MHHIPASLLPEAMDDEISAIAKDIITSGVSYSKNQ